MAKVRIVTDSVADLPPKVARDLNIAVVPLIVRFGTERYRDGVDLTAEQFYEKLKSSKVLPVTSVPPPMAFAEVYDEVARKTDEIVMISLSCKLSAVCTVATRAEQLMSRKARVKVVDSRWATMAQGFIVMKAAEAAKAGASVDEIVAGVERNIARVDLHATFTTLEYLRRGGRIGRAKAFVGSMLNINPIITLKAGVVEPVGRARSRVKAIDELVVFVGTYTRIEELAVGDAACPDDAARLVERLGSLFPKERIYRTGLTPAIGTHTGPGLLLVAVMGDKKR